MLRLNLGVDARSKPCGRLYPQWHLFSCCIHGTMLTRYYLYYLRWDTTYGVTTRGTDEGLWWLRRKRKGVRKWLTIGWCQSKSSILRTAFLGMPVFNIMLPSSAMEWSFWSFSGMPRNAVPRIELSLRHQPMVSHFCTPFLFLLNHHNPSFVSLVVTP